MLESPGFSAGAWVESWTDAQDVLHLGWYELSADAQAFLDALGRHGWTFVFDWRAWEDEARRLIEQGGVETAGVDDIRRLLTTLVRSDRFTEGQLAWAFESGLMVRIVCRLQELR